MKSCAKKTPVKSEPMGFASPVETSGQKKKTSKTKKRRFDFNDFLEDRLEAILDHVLDIFD